MNDFKRLWAQHKLVSVSLVILFFAVILCTIGFLRGNLEPWVLGVLIIVVACNYVALKRILREWGLKDGEK